MPSLTVENYVKAIFKVSGGRSDRRAATGQLATELSVSPGTVTSMLKTLSENGLATYTPYEGVRLSEEGRDLALRILRRHRLIELFLSRTLGLAWDEVHDDAERMEHVASDLLIQRIDEHLGHPTVDPHGDPIPAADGSFIIEPAHPLAECPPGCHFRLARVTDQRPDFLRYLREAGLSLAAEGRVVENQSEVGVVVVEVDGQQATLGQEAANKLLVTDEAGG